jgi:hypothetical protein
LVSASNGTHAGRITDIIVTMSMTTLRDSRTHDAGARRPVEERLNWIGTRSGF